MQAFKGSTDRVFTMLDDWFSTNGLRLNAAETQVIHFKTVQNKNSLSYYPFDLRQQKTIKLVGAFFNKN